MTVCRTFAPDQGFTALLLFADGQVTPGCHGSGMAGLAGSGGQTRVALGSAEAEHGDVDAVVVAALTACGNGLTSIPGIRDFLRGDL